MSLTSTQLTALKADIAADPTLNGQPMNSDGDAFISQAYDTQATPEYWVWRTRVKKAEYTQATSVDGTTFNWTGAGFITRTVGERDAWREIFNGVDECNPSLASVRQAFLDIFSGATVPAPANRTHLATTSRRRATRGEKLFATGAGTTGTPSLMGVEGTIAARDVTVAREL